MWLLRYIPIQEIMSKKATILSPVYNSANFIERHLINIINQTYRPIELILVNDGSNDNTEQIIELYRTRLIENNIELKYVYQENSGVGAAINTGLKLVTGDYLAWPDPDDILFPNTIQCEIDFLEKNTDCGLVHSHGYKYYEDDLSNPIEIIVNSVPNNGNIFKNVIDGNIVFSPCGYLLRMSFFREIYPNLVIFPSKSGQNIQILLPMCFHYKCGYIREPLYGRVDRPESLSKRVWVSENDAWKKRSLELRNIYIATLNHIGGEATAYIPYIEYRTLREIAGIAKKYDKDLYYKEKTVLIKSLKIMVVELFKSIINLLTGRY